MGKSFMSILSTTFIFNIFEELTSDSIPDKLEK